MDVALVAVVEPVLQTPVVAASLAVVVLFGEHEVGESARQFPTMVVPRNTVTAVDMWYAVMEVLLASLIWSNTVWVPEVVRSA